MLRGIKIRLYLNKEQTIDMNKLFGCNRFVYNQCLDYKISEYNEEGINVSLKDLQKYFHNTLRKEYEWLQEQNTKVLKQSIRDLIQAYDNFFTHCKGFPKFKARSNEQKVRFPREAVSRNTFNEDESRINLTKTFRGLKFRCLDRDKEYLFRNKEKIRSITITKTKSGKYFASVLVDGDILRIKHKPTNKVISFDLGIKSLMIFDNGETIENPKWIRNDEQQLKRLQRQLSRKEIGSNNREKARKRLAVKHEKIKNKKQDFINKMTTKIIDENQIIILEDLNVSGMLKNHKLSKSIQELGLYEIRRQLEYKAKWYQRDLIFVDRYYPSSKLCSDCGYKNDELTLNDREWTCPVCGKHHDRDLNAAINIKNEGLRLLNNKIRQRLPESTLADNPTMDDKE